MTLPSSLARKLGIVMLCLVCLAGACMLAWWQWDRYESASGTLQNLGYVLQWPLFGIFPAFMFWRIRKYSRRSGGAEPGAAASDAATGAPAVTQSTTDRAVVQPEEARSLAVPSPAASQLAPAPRQARSRLAYVPPTAEREPDDDAELAAYNRYLAELNAKQEERNVG